MGAPAIVIASTHHAAELGEAFARYEREYDVRMASDEATGQGGRQGAAHDRATRWRCSSSTATRTRTSSTR